MHDNKCALLTTATAKRNSHRSPSTLCEHKAADDKHAEARTHVWSVQAHHANAYDIMSQS